GELHAPEGRLDRLGERLDGECLGEPRHAFEQHVAVGEEPDEQPIDEGALADDDGRDLLAQPPSEARALAHALVDGGNASVHEADFVTRERRGAQIRGLPQPAGRRRIPRADALRPDRALAWPPRWSARARGRTSPAPGTPAARAAGGGIRGARRWARGPPSRPTAARPAPDRSWRRRRPRS